MIEEKNFKGIDKLLLYSGNDIPIIDLGINIHNPSLKELSLLTENGYLRAISIISITKEKFISATNMEEEEIEKYSLMDDLDFIFLSIYKKEEEIYFLTSFLSILFPLYNINLDFEKALIRLQHSKNKNKIIIDRDSFKILRPFIFELFGLNKTKPTNKKLSPLAQKIKDDLDRANAKKLKQKEAEEPSSKSALVNAISCCAIKSSIREIMEGTMVQLFDELARLKKYEDYHQLIDASMAGATLDEEIEAWTSDS